MTQTSNEHLADRLFYRVNNPSAWPHGFDEEASELFREAAAALRASSGVEVRPAFYGVWSGKIHVGTWADENTARDVAEEYDSPSIVPLYASPLPTASGVEVKGLEWGKTSYGRPEVDTIVGVYRVFEHMSGGWAATFKTFNLVDPHGRKNFATEAEAAAAVEADYRQRILSCLSSPLPTVEVTEEMVERACRVHHVGWSLWHEPQKKTAREVMRAALTAALSQNKATHRHKKRGTEYVLIGIGRMQAEDWEERDYAARDGEDSHRPIDMREVAIYRSATDPNEIWVRPREEFEDGRFEALSQNKGG